MKCCGWRFICKHFLAEARVDNMQYYSKNGSTYRAAYELDIQASVLTYGIDQAAHPLWKLSILEKTVRSPAQTQTRVKVARAE